MKKCMLAAVIAVAGALALASVASAITGKQEISAKIDQKNAGTKSKPRSVGHLTVTTTLTPGPGEIGKFATRQATIFFDKNIVFGGSKFASCSQAKAMTDACPTAARVGSGSANAQASIGGPESLSVKAWNGPNGNTIYLHVVGTAPLQIDGVLVGKLANSSGAYGKKLVVTIPPNLQQPVPNVFGTLTKFVTKVGGTNKGTPYVGLKGCSGGKLKIKGTFAYTDNTSQTATNTVSCKK